MAWFVLEMMQLPDVTDRFCLLEEDVRTYNFLCGGHFEWKYKEKP